MKQTILYCTDTLMAGGIERQLMELVTRLDQTRFEMIVLCLYGSKAGRSLHFYDALRQAGIQVIVLDLDWGMVSKLRAAGAILQAAWRFRPDIVHALNYHSNLLSRVVRPLMPRRTKLVGTVRVEQTTKQLRYHRLSWRMCDIIVCNSPHIKQQLVERAHLPQARVRVILNGVDIHRFAHNPDPGLRERTAPNKRWVLLMIGRISHQKAQSVLAEALGRLQQEGRLPDSVSVWMVGESEPYQRAEQQRLDDAVAQYALQDILIQHPHSPQPEAFYHAADLVILPSRLEGLPNVVLEALAAGRPVVVSAAANAAGVVEHQKTGWIVETNNVEHLADTLDVIFKLTPAELSDIGQACKAAAQQFSMEKMVHTYQELYAQVSRGVSPGR